ncbi:G4 quadruplex nucleic acid binding protein [Scheffersomyces spartinae]|uniref:G4 quadruplex nucleic acid binding protein n=1 Tax=Scheffersomyces spartinae TaxID=45513 RepID=A0A9P7V6F9_9ASCO|nr:G4 quadruplex nucleic acid binding protein [Scheffersomyces spartinae]KAG7192153.1 G4 quadruplex nucleic acid binding protein [Scheffersomyces spartinae]
MSDFLKQFKKLALADANSALESLFPELNKEEKALGVQYEIASTRVNEPESLIQLNNALRSQTFITGNKPSKSDIVVFANVFSVASKWTSLEDLSAFRHILRWADLVQNTLVDVPEKIAIKYDADIAREIKEKKKPADKAAAATAAPAAASKKEDKKVEQSKSTGGEQPQRKELTEEEKKARAEAQKAKKAAKAKANAEKAAKEKATAATAAIPSPAMVDFRVGFIQKAVKHPDADSLYMSTIDMGDEEGPRTVCSGLVKYIPIEEMQERYVVVIANLKPVTMRGVKSMAMVLCASNKGDNAVEFVNPPAGSKAGDKIFFEGFNGTPEKQLNPKKKIWETIQPLFTTTENFEVTYTEEGKPPARLVNEKGEVCKNSTLVGALVN